VVPFLAGCTPATPDFLALSSLTALRSLNLNYTNVEDAHVTQIVRCCTDITRLQLSRCPRLTSEATLREVLLGLPRLETLDVTNNACVSVGSFRRELSTAPGECSLILSASLTDLNVASCEGMSNAALAGLCESLPALTSLSLSKCRAISDWSPLFRSGLASSLTQLSLSLTLINDAGLASLARHMSALTNLELMDCRNISPAGLLCFASGGGESLRSLKLAWRGYRDVLEQLRESRPDIHATTRGM
jgi:Leucine-rich repeat (LRR) protein